MLDIDLLSITRNEFMRIASKHCILHDSNLTRASLKGGSTKGWHWTLNLLWSNFNM